MAFLVLGLGFGLGLGLIWVSVLGPGLWLIGMGFCSVLIVSLGRLLGISFDLRTERFEAMGFMGSWFEHV